MATATMVMGLGGDYDSTKAGALYAVLSDLDGVEYVEFNYTNNKVTVSFDPDRVSLKELESIIIQEKNHRDRPTQKIVEE